MYELKALRTLSRWPLLLLSALAYVLGAGIARYLGEPVRIRVLTLGLLATMLAQLGMNLLTEVYRPMADPHIEGETVEQRKAVRAILLYAAPAALACAGLIGILLLLIDEIAIAPLLTLGASILVTVLHAVPPIRVADRGFGELLIAIQIAYLAPSIGFLLQAGTGHGLLIACAVPLTVMLVASMIVLEFATLAQDLHRGRTTLVTRLGWQAALRLHLILMAMAYALLGVLGYLGFSLSLLGPAFLTVPFALLGVLLLRGIARGARPIWNLLVFNAYATFGLAVYVLALSFWLR